MFPVCVSDGWRWPHLSLGLLHGAALLCEALGMKWARLPVGSRESMFIVNLVCPAAAVGALAIGLHDLPPIRF